jgi:hypothetical protein
MSCGRFTGQNGLDFEDEVQHTQIGCASVVSERANREDSSGRCQALPRTKEHMRLLLLVSVCSQFATLTVHCDEQLFNNAPRIQPAGAGNAQEGGILGA